jgi:site-specific DNA-methyltransferase (adenine-specific)
MGAIIWQKVTTCNTTGGATVMGSYPYPRNGIIKLDYEFILIFKKPGNPPRVSKEIKELSKLTDEEWKQYFTGHWNFPGEKQDKHLAMFPEELPRRLIKMFSFVGETVLDPFLGSGTTSLAAKNLHRNSIGYEINEDFVPIIKEKLGINDNSRSKETVFEVVKQEDIKKDLKEEIEKLPYVFTDPLKFNRIVDPKTFKFGSKIDNSDYKKTMIYHKVKEIISPEILVLDTGLKIRLLGVKSRSEKINEAIQYMNENLKGQKVFLKFDSIKFDNENNLLCYVYLSNKTFINAHLIKKDLVDVDVNTEYKLKEKFLNLQIELTKKGEK